jgi:tetratricopeptide (TPR) repeat protein
MGEELEGRIAAGRPTDELDARVFLAEVSGRLFGAERSEPVTAGRYRLRQRLGVGGTGIVYCARDPDLDRDVAVKVLRPEHAGDARALLTEARRLATLNHANVVQIFDVGTCTVPGAGGEWVYLVMELAPGRTLRQWLTDAPRSAREVMAAFTAAARGLAAAHDRGIVHRDFKPGNVVVGRDRVRLLDFGLACATTTSTAAHAPAVDDTADTPAWHGGTPGYMSPEQRRNAPVGPASDQYSFCVALWEALTGERPRIDDDGRLVADVGSPLPPRVRAVLERGLSIEADDRWPTMHVLLERLAATGRRRVPRVAGALLVGLAALGLVARAPEEATGPCEALRRRIESAWSPARAEEIGAVLAEDAVDAWSRRRAGVDDWQARFGRQLAEICDAPQVPRPGDGRIACLEGLAARLALQLDDVVASESARHAAALDALAELPTPESCAAATTACGDAIDGVQSARIDALASRGSYAEARELARAALAGAEEGAPSICIARAALRLGRIEMFLGAEDDALAHLEAAVAWAGAQRREDLEVSAVAEVALIQLVGRHRAEIEAARRWGERAEATVAALPVDHPLRASVDCQIGGVEVRAGAWADGRTRLRRCIDALEDGGRSEETVTADAYMLLGGAERGVGDLAAARVASQTSVTLYENALGPSHPALLVPLNNLAAMHDAAGDRETARGLWSRALAIADERLGADHPARVLLLTNLALLAGREGDVERQVELFTHAWSIAEARLGAQHPDTATTRCQLGAAILERDDTAGEAARVHLDPAFATLERELPATHTERVRCAAAVARAFLSQGEPDRAREQAAGIDDALSDPTLPPSERVELLLQVGDLWRRLDEPVTARARLEEARRLVAPAELPLDVRADVEEALDALGPPPDDAAAP